MSGGINAIGNLQGKVDADGNLCVSVTGVSGVPGSPVNSVQFNSAGSFAGDAGLTYAAATNILTIGGYPIDPDNFAANTLAMVTPVGTGLYFSGDDDSVTAATLDLSLTGAAALYGGAGILLQSGDEVTVTAVGAVVIQSGTRVVIDAGTDKTILVRTLVADDAEPIASYAQIGSAGFDVSGNMIASSAVGQATGNSVINVMSSVYLQPNVADTAQITSVYGAYFAPTAKAAGAAITNSYAFYSVDLLSYGTNPYFLWYDGGPGGDANGAGVFRVNQFGILAYYNPAFTKYTPGLANFERELIRWGDTGVFGTDNVAYMGVEAGGTGTNRVLSLLGASVQAETIPGTAAFLKGKLQTSANATTGLVAGVLAALTNASIVVTDGSGQAYRVPCII